MSNFKKIFKCILPLFSLLFLKVVTEMLHSCNYLFESPIGNISLLRKLSHSQTDGLDFIDN